MPSNRAGSSRGPEELIDEFEEGETDGIYYNPEWLEAWSGFIADDTRERFYLLDSKGDTDDQNTQHFKEKYEGGVNKRLSHARFPEKDVEIKERKSGGELYQIGYVNGEPAIVLAGATEYSSSTGNEQLDALAETLGTSTQKQSR